MGRRNTVRGRRPQAKRSPHPRPAGRPAPHRRPSTPLRDIVLPVGKCGHKLMFTEGDAPTALRQAQARREAKGLAHVEKRYYLCGRCNHYHLTSRETWQERNAE